MKRTVLGSVATTRAWLEAVGSSRRSSTDPPKHDELLSCSAAGGKNGAPGAIDRCANRGDSSSACARGLRRPSPASGVFGRPPTVLVSKTDRTQEGRRCLVQCRRQPLAIEVPRLNELWPRRRTPRRWRRVVSPSDLGDGRERASSAFAFYAIVLPFLPDSQRPRRRSSVRRKRHGGWCQAGGIRKGDDLVGSISMTAASIPNAQAHRAADIRGRFRRACD